MIVLDSFHRLFKLESDLGMLFIKRAFVCFDLIFKSIDLVVNECQLLLDRVYHFIQMDGIRHHDRSLLTTRESAIPQAC
jgi:hypothetical protein